MGNQKENTTSKAITEISVAHVSYVVSSSRHLPQSVAIQNTSKIVTHHASRVFERRGSSVL